MSQYCLFFGKDDSPPCRQHSVVPLISSCQCHLEFFHFPISFAQHAGHQDSNQTYRKDVDIAGAYCQLRCLSKSPQLFQFDGCQSSFASPKDIFSARDQD
jgi:hypothetical protein